MVYNVDGMRRSAYYFKDRDGKLNAGPIWDYHRSLNPSESRAQNPQSWNNIDYNYFSDDWWGQLFQDPGFVQVWVDRWQQLRTGALSTANMQAIIGPFAAQINSAAVARDAAKWPPNALEHSRGTNPLVCDAQIPLTPTLTRQLASGATRYVCTFTKPVDRPGATYQVQQSTDLLNRTASADTLVSKNLETETRAVTVNVSNGNPPKRFFRLSVAVGR